jgi:hypothetical protein
VQGAFELHMKSTTLFEVDDPEILAKWMSSQRKVDVLAYDWLRAE